eukprot:TRINITY_DN54414_c0_g1_i1.p1 TRINITY_DN54414_c0_g1~~TRINITY_DN54414_c0_g1_i1.p1  ORF type:complete len:395 (-),score=100.08 TRINITY_DN54414_c0_g1_i1:297-1481(-)
MASEVPAAHVCCISFEDRSIDITSGSSLEEVQTEVELQLGLSSSSYDLSDGFGKIDTDAALQRAWRMAAGGNCALQIQEHTEWQRIRQLDTQIQILKARELENGKAFGQLVGAAMNQLEDRILAKVNQALSNAKGGSDQVAIKADLAEQLSSQIQDLRARMDGLGGQAESLEVEMNEQAINSSCLNGHLERGLSEVKKELETLQPLSEKVEDLEMELNEQALTASSLNGHLESAVMTAKQEIETLRSYAAQSVQDLSSAGAELRAQLKAAQNDSKKAQDRVKELEEEVSRLKAQQRGSEASSSFALLAPRASAGTRAEEQSWVREVTASQMPKFTSGVDGSCWSMDCAGRSPSTFAKKSPWLKAQNQQMAGASAAPFALGSAPRLQSSQSLPQL